MIHFSYSFCVRWLLFVHILQAHTVRYATFVMVKAPPVFVA